MTKIKVDMLKSDQNRRTYPNGLITPSLLVGEYLNVSRLIKDDKKHRLIHPNTSI